MLKPIAIILTDTHLSPSTEEINISIYKQVIKLANEFGLNVFHGGDIFESRKAQPLSVLTTFESVLDMFLESGVKMFAIPGNHDKSDYRSKKSYLDPFKHHPAFHLVDAFDTIVLNENYDMVMIPFFNESDTYSDYLDKAIKTIDDGKKSFLLTHIAVNGVKNNDGTKVENNITNEKFNVFEKVLIGHYHNQSVIGKKIVYIGSAYQANYGEDLKKGFCIVYENGEIDYIRSEFPAFKEITIELDNVTPNQAENLIQEYSDSEDNIRFVFKGTYEQVNAVDKNKFKKEGIDVKLKSSEIDLGVIEATNDEFISFDKKGIEDEFDTFCELNKIENFEVGKKYLKQILN